MVEMAVRYGVLSSRSTQCRQAKEQAQERNTASYSVNEHDGRREMDPWCVHARIGWKRSAASMGALTGGGAR